MHCPLLAQDEPCKGWEGIPHLAVAEDTEEKIRCVPLWKKMSVSSHCSQDDSSGGTEHHIRGHWMEVVPWTQHIISCVFASRLLQVRQVTERIQMLSVPRVFLIVDWMG